MSTKTCAVVSALILLSIGAMPAASQNVQTVQCSRNQTLTGNYADVIVRSTGSQTCTLSGATVNGSVKMETSGRLTIRNGTMVFGGVEVKNSGGAIRLDAAHVLGDIKLEQGRNLTVEGASDVRNISMKSSAGVAIVTIIGPAITGDVIAETIGGTSTIRVENGAAVASVLKTGAGNTTITGARIFPGGVTTVLAGQMGICGAEIGFNSEGTPENGGVPVGGSGGVSAIVSGALNVGDGCDPSIIEGSVLVDKGAGAVAIVNATLNSGDLIVIDRTGNVTAMGASFGDVTISEVDGDIILDRIATASDVTISKVDGNITLDRITTDGDVEIQSSGSVTISGASFDLEDVYLSKNSSVRLEQNINFNVTATENGSATILDNKFTDANIAKNGIVSIVGSTGVSLVCQDNVNITGSGNTMEFTDGQCAGF